MDYKNYLTGLRAVVANVRNKESLSCYLFRLTWLPVVEDTEEAPHVYSLLCELAAGGHPALATPDAPRHVIATLAEAFLRDAVPNDNPVYAQMVALVRQIQVTLIVLSN